MFPLLGLVVAMTIHPHHADREFLQDAERREDGIVSLALLGVERASDASTRSFARGIIELHDSIESDLRRVSLSAGVDALRISDPEGRAVVRELTSIAGSDFDRVLIVRLTDSLSARSESFAREAAHGHDPELRNFAQSHVSAIADQLAEASGLVLREHTAQVAVKSSAAAAPIARPTPAPRDGRELGDVALSGGHPLNAAPQASASASPSTPIAGSSSPPPPPAPTSAPIPASTSEPAPARMSPAPTSSSTGAPTPIPVGSSRLHLAPATPLVSTTAVPTSSPLPLPSRAASPTPPSPAASEASATPDVTPAPSPKPSTMPQPSPSAAPSRAPSAAPSPTPSSESPSPAESASPTPSATSTSNASR